MFKSFEIFKMKAIFGLGFIGSWCLSFLMATGISVGGDIIAYCISGIMVTVMQTFSFYFLRKGYRGMAYVFIFISILGNITFWYNQNTAYMDKKLNGSEQIQSIEKKNIAIDKVLKSSEVAQVDTKNDYETQIQEKNNDILELQLKIAAEKKSADNKYESWVAANKSWAGAYQKNEKKIELDKARDLNIAAIEVKIDNIKKLKDTLASDKITNSTSLIDDSKKLIEEYKSIDLSKTSKSIIYSEGYLGIAERIGGFIGWDSLTIIFILISFIGTAFELGLLKAKLLLIEVLGNIETLEVNHKKATLKEKIKDNIVNAKSRATNIFSGKKPNVTAQNNIVHSSNIETAAIESKFFPNEAIEEAKKPIRKIDTIGFRPQEKEIKHVDGALKLDDDLINDIKFMLEQKKSNGNLWGIKNLTKFCSENKIKNARSTWELMKKLKIINVSDGNNTTINPSGVKKWIS